MPKDNNKSMINSTIGVFQKKKLNNRKNHPWSRKNSSLN
jgi:hypothetical protein